MNKILAMSVKEAKKKWCPMVMMSVKLESGKPYLAGNRPIHKLEGYCITSDCMMWIWEVSGGPNRAGYCGFINSNFLKD